MFSFPLKNKEHTENWLKNIKRKGFIPTEYSRLCSKHFLPSDFKPYNKENGRLRLNDNAVPLVFNSSTEEVHCQSIIETYEVEAEGPLDLNMPELCEELLVIPQRSVLVIGIITTPKTSTVLFPKLQITPKRPSYEIPIRELLQDIKEKGLIEENGYNVILENFDGMSCEIFNNQLKTKNKNAKNRRYSDELKKLALTLNYYSPKAYKYCRTIFKIPHPTAIRSWTSSINGETEIENKEFNLVFDAMCIKKQVIWNKQAHKFTGYNDYGDNLTVESSET
ncbi:hypothetical protein QTP88_023781 [Uroleucon formosanum]